MSTLYNNHDSIEKQECREKIIRFVEKLHEKKKNLRILTLPSTNFYLEEVLSNIPGVVIECVEREKDIYEKQLKIIQGRKLNINLKNQDIFEYIKESNTKFDLIWLDLCGPFNKSIISNFISLIQTGDNLHSQSYIVLTILGKREQQGPDIIKFYGCKNLKEFRESKFPKLVGEMSDNTCTLQDLYQYPSGRMHTPMIQYSFINNFKNQLND